MTIVLTACIVLLFSGWIISLKQGTRHDLSEDEARTSPDEARTSPRAGCTSSEEQPKGGIVHTHGTMRRHSGKKGQNYRASNGVQTFVIG